MKINRKIAVSVVGAGALAAGGAGVAVASSDDDGNEVPIRGEALDSATAAALEATGGGKVTETEVGDEEGAYEVEVTLPDGSETDVHLDEGFNLLGTEAEGSGPDDDGNGRG